MPHNANSVDGLCFWGNGLFAARSEFTLDACIEMSNDKAINKILKTYKKGGSHAPIESILSLK